MPFLSKIGTFSSFKESCFAAGGTMFVKNVLLFINFLSMLAGIILIGGGAYIKTSISTSDIMNLSSGIAAAAITTGVFITLISFLGCFGAANEKGMLLKTYFALLLVLVITEIAVGAAAYHQSDELNGLIENSWRQLATRYPNATLANPLFQLETSLQCCGLKNVTDAAVPFDCALRFPYTTPCYEIIGNTLNNSLDTIGGTGVIMGAIELISLIFSAILFHRIAVREKANGSLVNESWRINRNKVQYGYQNYQYL